MKKPWFIQLFLSFCLFSTIHSVEGERFLQSEEAAQLATYGHIDAKGLKSLIDSNTPLTLIDARGSKWHDNSRIPGAELVSYEDSLETIEAIAPQKDGLIVVYCFSFTCPLSTRLASKLIEYGYTHVIEYSGGLKQWREIAGYPIERIE